MAANSIISSVYFLDTIDIWIFMNDEWRGVGKAWLGALKTLLKAYYIAVGAAGG